MAATPEAIKPPTTTVGAIGWVRANLLSAWYNTLLTAFSVVFLYFLLKGVLTWVFVTADWSVVTSNVKLFLVGQYPSDQMWRAGAGVHMVSLFMGLSWGVWGGVARPFALTLAIGLGLSALAPVGLDSMGIGVRGFLIANPALVAFGYLMAQTRIGQSRWLLTGWLLSFFLTLILLRGIEGIPGLSVVPTGIWGGLLLTFLLAVVGIVASFPLGVLLALGRRSNLPVVKVFSIAFIELVRGVPLVSILFMGQVIMPLFLPEEIRIDRVVRVMLAITLFSSAYMAENVRGGLQAVPRGQIEAARALGLSGSQAMLFIVLPQALRAVIPAIAGQFISLFKDTSLAVIVGLLEVLGIGKSIILGNVQWIGSQREVYLFIGAVFWVFTYSLSYASRRLETTLGVGTR